MKLKIIFSTLILGTLMGCSDVTFEDAQEPYGAVTEPNVIYLVNNTLGSLIDDQFQYWNHHKARPNTGSDSYFNRNETNPWNTAYNSSRDLQEVLNLTENMADQNEINARAMALFLRSFYFLRVTDAYGDIPYSKSGQLDDSGIVIKTPAYDSQESIYIDCFANITKAIELIGSTSQFFMGEADYIYHEDFQKWKTFANTVRLRMALRITGVNPSLANTWFTEVAKYPVINSHDESATFERFNLDGYKNPNYHDNPNISRMSKLFVNYLQDNNDPRLTKFVSQNVNGIYVGMENGLFTTGNTDEYSDIGAELAIVDRAAPILLYDEVCLIKAEMYLEGFSVGADATQANTWYQKGIRANMEYYNVATADIDTFIAGAAEATLNGTTENQRRQIASQKWIGGIRNGFELFNNMRRTGYPVIENRVEGSAPDVSLGETNGVWPRRLKYPDNEMFLQYRKF